MQSTREIDRYAYAHDASHFLLIPSVVDVAQDLHEIAEILRAAKTHLTFRSGGTSLSGQASSDGLMIDSRKNFKKITILDQGARVRVQPGATVREINNRLARYGYKLGPDPASEIACTIGGVIANNSSGMLCGTEFNTYKTIESLVLVFPSGNILDTSNISADQQFRELEPAIYQGLEKIRDRIRNNPHSVEKIQKLFSIKNTMGYAINAFLDFESPLDILIHLIVGSEGTLAFIAEATFRTVPLHPHVATGFLVFDSIKGATSALPALVETGISAIELLDATSLTVAQRDPKATELLQKLTVDKHAGLLVEFQELTENALADRLYEGSELIRSLKLHSFSELSSDGEVRSNLWHIRKGLYATIAGSRRPGTTALLEDIAVPVPTLAYTCESLIDLFQKHHYRDSVIFGHARDGNIHFMLNEDFTDPRDIARYSRFTDEMVELVLSHEGTLKAEHGTGRVMAPFVEQQYGSELYSVMKDIKRLFDPQNKLNPGVLISDDPTIHLKSFKTAPVIDEEVDRCVECGYCEPVCPSRNLTLTPRQRIVIRREMEDAQSKNDNAKYRALAKDFSYDSIDTCAVDGMCSTSCPVQINTGDLVRKLRAENLPQVQRVGWRTLAHSWGLATRALSTGLKVAHVLPMPRALRLPQGGRVRKGGAAASAEVIYFPSCTSTLFDSSVREAFLKLCEKAQIEVATPKGIGSLCCGQPWKSKGASEGHQIMKNKTAEWITAARCKPNMVVISDATSCTEALKAFGPTADITEFVVTNILPKITIRKISSLALHPTCSSVQIDSNKALNILASKMADEVFIPQSWNCCAFAGDRGILHPELTASATAAMAVEIAENEYQAYVSNNRTCEIGMSRATGKPYRHIIEQLAEQVL